MKAGICLFAETIVVDEVSKSISVFNLYEELRFRTMPSFVPKLFILFTTEKEGGDAEEISAEVSVFNNKELIHKGNSSIKYGGLERARNIIGYGGLVIMNPGELRAELRVGENLIAECKIPVSSVSTELPFQEPTAAVNIPTVS